MSGPKKERRGLGRGLTALMADVNLPDNVAGDQGTGAQTVELPVEALLPNPDQPRRDFRAEDLESLAASIRAAFWTGCGYREKSSSTAS